VADPTLIIHFSPLEGSSEGSSPSTFELGDDGKEIAWYALAKCQPLRISNGQTTGKEVSVFSLPFPLAVVPYFLEVLNALQQIDESSQSSDAFKKIELDKVQIDTLEDLGLKSQVETLQNLKFLEKDGSLCEKPYENLGRWIGEALRRNSQINAALQSLFEDARANQDQNENDSKTGYGEIVLRFEPDPKVLALAAIPWELAYYPEDEPLLMHLGGQVLLGCTRTIVNNAKSSKSCEIGDSIHLLTVTSLQEMSSRDRVLERAARTSLRKAIGRYKVTLDSLEPVSISHLREKLSTAHYDILDYWGHGGIDKDGCTILLMDNDDRQRENVATSVFINLPQHPHAIFLHACDTAHVDIHRVSGSLALELNRVGVKAVLAMQLAIRMQDISDMVIPTLYEELAAQHSIQRAVAAFRQKLYTHTPAVSWYVPVLYVQSVEPYQPYSPFKPATPVVNPFVLGPAAHTQKFIGRRAEMKKMWEWVRCNYSFSIVGPAGAGKTRMMRLIKDGKKEGKIDKSTSIIWIELYGGMDRKDVEQEIMRELRAEKGAHIREVLNGKHILILLDKLYRLNPGGDRDLLERLASLPSYDGVQLVVTIREPIADLFPQEEPSSLYEIANMSIRLECFNKGEIEELVKDRLASTAFKFEDFNDVLKEQMTPRDLLIACHKKFNELTQS
jgi:hypothetical protein